jgi:hypothetical protein
MRTGKLKWRLLSEGVAVSCSGWEGFGVSARMRKTEREYPRDYSRRRLCSGINAVMRHLWTRFLAQNVDLCQDISVSATKKWGFGNGIANYYAEIALHFGKLIATI